jgi:hypothetical protein
MAKPSLSNSTIKQQIVERLRKIPPDSPRQWGRMTVNQMLCHLCDSFRVTMGMKPWKTTRISVTPLPRPEVDVERGGTPPSAFDQDKANLFALLDRFTRQPRDFEWQPHPIFGSMSDADWMRWGYLHMDHHLRQFGG